MPRTVDRPRPLQWQVFRARDALDRRLVTPAGLRTRAWQRVLRGVYADSRLDLDHLLRCQAAALVAPPEAVIAGPSAAYLHGIASAARDDDPVHLLVERKHRFGPVQGVRVHTGAVPAAEVGTRQGLRCTRGLRTAWDVARWQHLLGSVPTLDALLGSEVVTADALVALAERRRRDAAYGAGRAGRAIALADGRAGSPPESALRVRLILSGLPRPVPQHPVPVRSGRVLHPDLAWPVQRVALEYDGAYHAEPDRLHLDRRRLNALADAGWLVLHATSRRLATDFGGLVREVRRALRSRGGP